MSFIILLLHVASLLASWLLSPVFIGLTKCLHFVSILGPDYITFPQFKRTNSLGWRSVVCRQTASFGSEASQAFKLTSG